MDCNIPKKPTTRCFVYNFKKANWNGLKEILEITPWDTAFVPGDIDTSLSNWCDLFLSAVKDHVPICKARNVHDHPWIDSGRLTMIKQKNKQRMKARKTGNPDDFQRYKDLRRNTKRLMAQKRKDSAHKIRDSLRDNPKRFWSFVKTSSTLRTNPIILRDDQRVATDRLSRANLLNSFFTSIFTPAGAEPPVPSDTVQPTSNQRLSDIQLTVSEVAAVLENLDPSKASGPDNIPGRLLKGTAREIAPSLCRLFNLSLSLGSVPSSWKRANITPVFKKGDPPVPRTTDQSRCCAQFRKYWNAVCSTTPAHTCRNSFTISSTGSWKGAPQWHNFWRSTIKSWPL